MIILVFFAISVNLVYSNKSKKVRRYFRAFKTGDINKASSDSAVNNSNERQKEYTHERYDYYSETNNRDYNRDDFRG